MRDSIRLQQVQTPIIPVVGDLIRQHPGTISLGQGVVHYGPPQQAIDHIKHFLSDPDNHKYKSVYGIPPLIEAITEKLRRENVIVVTRNSRIVVTAGGNMGFVNAVLAVGDPGDEIILLAPYYFNHEMAVTMVNCRAVIVPTDENYQLQPAVIESAITKKTRAVVTISPNNPSGAVYSEESLRAVNAICCRHGVYHINDEAYEYFTYNGAQHFSPGSIGGSATHTISLFSLSKAYGFASWRIGYMVIPEHLYSAVTKIQDTILICPPVISQYAAVGAMRAGAGYCLEQLHVFEEVRALALSEFEAIRSICTIPRADGAFYFLAKIHTDMDPMVLVETLIRDYGVAVIPGMTFGMTDGCYLRIAYGALQKETVAEGIGRLVRGLKAIVKA
jgi:aspartate/methionine/tyrosine aminotransferase